MGNYIDCYGSTMTGVGATLKGALNWTPESTVKIVQQMKDRIPLDTLQVSGLRVTFDLLFDCKNIYLS